MEQSDDDLDDRNEPFTEEQEEARREMVAELARVRAEIEAEVDAAFLPREVLERFDRATKAIEIRETFRVVEKQEPISKNFVFIREKK